MSEHACLLAAMLHDPFGHTDRHFTTRQAYRSLWSRVTRAWGRVASSCRGSAYHFVAVTGCTLVLGLIAAGA